MFSTIGALFAGSIFVLLVVAVHYYTTRSPRTKDLCPECGSTCRTSRRYDHPMSTLTKVCENSKCGWVSPPVWEQNNREGSMFVDRSTTA